MMKDMAELEAILGTLEYALRKTQSDGSPMHSDYADQLLQITELYSKTVMSDPVRHSGSLQWPVPRRVLTDLSNRAAELAQTGDWQGALEQSHATLSALPGEPGGIPMTPPKLPW